MSTKKSKKQLRKLIRQVHLWLGMATGLVVFIVALTGCLWVFQEEIKALNRDLPEIEAQDQVPILPQKARQLAEEALPGHHVHGTLYAGSNEPVEVIFYEPDPEFYQSVFLHPYSGEVLKIEDHMQGFFPFVLEGHMHLWLPEEIGSQIVAWSTVIFVIMLITGIVLWWPKNKKIRKQRFSFQWNKSTKWKRKNYDLHQVGGFYASFFALIIAFTGLVMTFDAFEKYTYRALGGEKQVKFVVPENISETPANPKEMSGIDGLLPKLSREFPQAESLEFHYPYTDYSSIYVEVTYQEGVYYSADYRFYDQYTLEEVSTPSIYGVYDEAGFSEKVIRMNYDIHVGAIGGLAGKILAFVISLVCASLPVTGFMIWYGRKFKKTKKVKTKKPSFSLKPAFSR